MPFVAIGVEHKTAPLSVREQVALDVGTIERVSRELIASPCIVEVAVLSTCNRTELYLFADEVAAAIDMAEELLLARGLPDIRSYLQVWHEMEAIGHLFRVASGLESQVRGEREILGQVRETLETGQRLETIGPNLHALFRSAISCARQARAGTKSELGGGALRTVRRSVGTEAVRAIEGALGGLEGKAVLLIGGGATSRLVAEELRGRKLRALYIANRTAAVAADLAKQFGGRAATLGDIPRLIPHVDAIISATGARHAVLTAEDVPQGTLEGRRSPLHVADLAVPRDVDPALAGMEGIVLHDLESLVPGEAEAIWDQDVEAMEGVIAAEVQDFMAWYLTRRAVPVIANLRSHVEAVQRQELKRVSGQLRNLSEQERAAVEALTQRLIDKMFHHLVVRLRLAAQIDPRLVEAAEFFFLHGEGGLFAHAAETEAKLPQESGRE